MVDVEIMWLLYLLVREGREGMFGRGSTYLVHDTEDDLGVISIFLSPLKMLVFHFTY